MTTDLDRQLLEAHASGDKTLLVTLYAEAAEAAGTPEQTAFYLTHAWVFALEAGDPRAETYRTELVSHGRAD